MFLKMDNPSKKEIKEGFKRFEEVLINYHKI